MTKKKKGKTMYGISAFGSYVPRYRLDRRLIYQAMGWFNPANIAYANGEKAIANFDEDSITMAVAAGRDTLNDTERSSVDTIYFASTSMPYAERLNAGIIAEGLRLKESVRAADYTGSRKAGTTALLAAIDAVAAGHSEQAIVCSSDCRVALPASSQELIFGDGAASLLIGKEDVIAEFKGSFSTTHDFVDHLRGSHTAFDRQWEERWIRDAGYAKLVPEAVGGLLNKYGLKIGDFARVVYDCHYPAARKDLNKLLGITKEKEVKNFQEEIGHCGAAHALMMLVHALENSNPGDKILVVSFGGGCDALYLEVTDRIRSAGRLNSFSKRLKMREPLDSYMKYLVWRNILPVDEGLRAEEDEWTRWSLMWRKRKEIHGLWGSKCTSCGTPQYPVQRICVNPECGATDTMEPYCFADKIGHIASYTGDMLAASENPPSIYGPIEFEGGGKYLFDIADSKLNELAVGMNVSMIFRRKYYDKKRDISGYFWKALPYKEVEL